MMSSEGTAENSPEERYQQLVELSPSAKYVFKILQHGGKLTQDELAERTLLPKRTIQYALDRLKEKGLIEPEIDVSDARCRKYSPNEIRRSDEG